MQFIFTLVWNYGIRGIFGNCRRNQKQFTLAHFVNLPILEANILMTGKMLIILGVILILAGIIVNYSDRIPFPGKLPGDISIERGNFKFYFPIATCILLSLAISIIMILINRYKN